MDPIARTVAAALARHRLGGAAVAVACSGGTDSVVLAHVAAALGRDGQLGPVRLVHVDHGLRADAAAVGGQVAALGRSLALPVDVLAVTVGRGASLEAEARTARYAALASYRPELAAILLGHSATDQAETVLLRLLRGTGPAGLAAMAERRGRYLRPLLGVGRAALADYRAQHQLEADHDPMNQDLRFARARLRLEVWPALARQNPRLEQALGRLAASAGEQREAIEHAAEALGERAGIGEPGLDVAVLATAPAAVRKALLAGRWQALGGRELGARHLDALDRLVLAPVAGSRQLDLPGGRAIREYSALRLEVGQAAGDPAVPAITVEGPDPPYEVRRWRPGDRLRLDRLGGRSRKLSDLYIDARVPRALRGRARVVIGPGGAIEWAEHVGSAAGSRARVNLTPPDPMASNKD